MWAGFIAWIAAHQVQLAYFSLIFSLLRLQRVLVSGMLLVFKIKIRFEAICSFLKVFSLKSASDTIHSNAPVHNSPNTPKGAVNTRLCCVELSNLLTHTLRQL